MAANKAANNPNNTAAATTITNGGYTLTSSITSAAYTYPTVGGYYGVGGGGGNITASNIGVSQWGSQPAANLDMDGVLQLNGKNADIKINNISLNETLKTIQERLNILVPNSLFENEWDELKKLGEQYRKLEAELEEKSRMWAALKKTE